MKTKLFIILMVISSCLITSCGTMIGVQGTPEMRTFEKIIEVPNKSKADIYISTNTWFVENFNSAESVIEFQDKESGKIMGKYVYIYMDGIYNQMVKQIISIDIKDGKVRLFISEPCLKTIGDALNGIYIKTNNYKPLTTLKGLQKANEEWGKLALSLDNALNTTLSW